MKLKKRGHIHAVDFLFSLSLFCVFAVLAFIIVLIGVHVYKNTVTEMQNTYSSRTALSYVAEKIRQHDSDGHIFLTEFDGCNALLLKDETCGEIYDTYIYSDGGALYELVVSENTVPAKDMGEKIIEVNKFTITAQDGGFYYFSAEDASGAQMSLLFHPRSIQN